MIIINKIFISDVGDGLCFGIYNMCDQYMQVDCGSFKGEKAFAGLKRITSIWGSPDVFVLSHFHADHYNGLIHYSRKYSYSSAEEKLNIKRVYYPRLPEFPERKKLLLAILTINIRTLGDSSGIMQRDLLQVISSINIRPFIHRGVSKGDNVELGGSIFEVLWPPRFVDYYTIKPIKEALRAFDKALEQDEKSREIYDTLIKKGIYGRYLEDEERDYRDDQKFETKIKKELALDEFEEIVRRDIPDCVKSANNLLRKVANRLSLCFKEDNRLLFLGDLENKEIKEVISRLNPFQKCFHIMIAPHHGTHWSDELYSISCNNIVLSHGKKLCSRMCSEYKNPLFPNIFSTFVNGDIYGCTAFGPCAIIK